MLKKLVCLFAYSTLLAMTCAAHEANDVNHDEVKKVEEQQVEDQATKLLAVSEKEEVEQEEAEAEAKLA